ncbi:MAG: TGS domain-containing protein, partial [Steroidobacteraceae bacterium]
TLTRDTALAQAVLIRGAHPGPITPDDTARITALVGPQVTVLLRELTRFGELDFSSRWSAAQGLNLRQAETLRKMLLAVVSDPRLVLARLAAQLVRVRHAKGLDADARRRLALESREIYAPLANRLGVWNVKWELEDLAFRDLEPDAYHHIAAALNEKRADRERYIQRVCELLATQLAEAGVHAQVTGRPKHIYSIHRKMLRKQLEFEHVFDVRAVRVIVATVSECYAALGVVHGLWPYLPGEFDDYIATPKGNFYRSIHTAVIGPEERSLEIQIRTPDMQEHAELGVAAHWLYKEGAAQDKSYERKIQWLRGLLSGASAAGDGEQDFIQQISGNLFNDRIYALTPKGEVIDVPRGATPLDFAYHVHTGLGHRCRGARVNGRIVPLTHALANGDVVDIITAKTGAPSRDWLAPDQGYLVSNRSRAKVRAWFRALDAKTAPDAAKHRAEEPAPEDVPTSTPRRTRTRIKPARSPVAIEGVGDLPVTLARCCAPVRPEPITGYVTLGRGVTIHAANCPSATRMHRLRPDRSLRVEWAENRDDKLPVEIAIEAFDRRGLLRDVTDLIAEQKLSIEGVSSATDPEDHIARISLRLGVRDLDELSRLLLRLKRIPNVLVARRMH